jgi:hypothetical protein
MTLILMKAIAVFTHHVGVIPLQTMLLLPLPTTTLLEGAHRKAS